MLCNILAAWLFTGALVATAPSSYASTIYTDDILDGNKVISELDVSDLPTGMHRFWFRGTENGIGGYHHLPIMVAKGSVNGTVVFLQSSIHGDELQGTQVIHAVFDHLATYACNDKNTTTDADPEGQQLTSEEKEGPSSCDNMDFLTGTIVGIIGANPTGMLAHSRTGRFTTDGMEATNLNRVMPGSNSSSEAGSHFAFAVWNYLYGSNPDVFLDLHTQSRGTVYPFFIYSDRRDETVDRLVQLMPADIVKDDPGEPGTVETEMVASGVPAMTIELGAPKIWDKNMTVRGAQGILNAMYDLGMMEGTLDMLGVETYYANDLTSVRAERGGYSEILVGLTEDVEEGQVIAKQFNAFGDVIIEYTAPFSGRVLSIGTDPIREPGALLVRLVRQVEE